MARRVPDMSKKLREIGAPSHFIYRGYKMDPTMPSVVEWWNEGRTRDYAEARAWLRRQHEKGRQWCCVVVQETGDVMEPDGSGTDDAAHVDFGPDWRTSTPGHRVRPYDRSWTRS